MYASPIFRPPVLNWSLVRLGACVAVLVDLVAFFSGWASARSTRGLYPLFLIARELDTRQLLQGLGRSIRRSSIVSGQGPGAGAWGWG